MKNEKLLKLAKKLQSASENPDSMISLSHENAAGIMGGHDNIINDGCNNPGCTGGTNQGCTNSLCGGQIHNTSCSNGSCY